MFLWVNNKALNNQLFVRKCFRSLCSRSGRSIKSKLFLFIGVILSLLSVPLWEQILLTVTTLAKNSETVPSVPKHLKQFDKLLDESRPFTRLRPAWCPQLLSPLISLYVNPLGHDLWFVEGWQTVVPSCSKSFLSCKSSSEQMRESETLWYLSYYNSILWGETLASCFEFKCF